MCLGQAGSRPAAVSSSAESTWAGLEEGMGSGSAVLVGERLHLVTGCEDLAALTGDDLAQGGGDVLLQRLVVLADGMLLALLRGLQHGLGGGTRESVLEGDPAAVDRSGGGAGLVDV